MMSPARILIVRPDHLGDLLLTLSAITALRGALPDARIIFLVPVGLEAVPDHCPAVDQTDTVAFPHCWPHWSDPTGTDAP
jgi:ADP-heptose:LPS heptosyltransferase